MLNRLRQKCMEFGLKCCLGVIMCLWVLGKSSHGEVTLSYCKFSSVKQKFPGYLVPNNLRFMLFYQREETSTNVLNEENLCLDEVNNTVLLLPCSHEKSSQKWFQFGNLIINIKYGNNIAVDTSGRDLNVTTGLVSNNSQPWSCNTGYVENATLSVNIAGNLSYLDVMIEIKKVTLSTLPNSRWGVASDIGHTKSSMDQVCKKRNPYCGPPMPGMNSFILSSLPDYSSYYDLSTELLLRAINTGVKVCYSAGDYIVHGCQLGHVQITNPSKTFREMTCLGDGKWSNPVPFHCTKRNCGRPTDYPHAKFYERSYYYGSLVSYMCDVKYEGKTVFHICGPEGKWIGETPRCIHICTSELTNATGLLTSPNYPKPYPPSITCQWKIIAPKGMKIALWFRDFFIEPGSLLPGPCRFDFLFVNDSYVPKQSYYCGSTYPSRWLSDSNAVNLIFSSDSTYQAKGFKIEYTIWNSSLTTTPKTPSRNGTFLDEADKTYVFTSSEYTTYFIQGLYLALVVMIVLFVIMIIVAHCFKRLGYSCATRIHAEIDADRERRNAVADFVSQAQENVKQSVKTPDRKSALSSDGDNSTKSKTTHLPVVTNPTLRISDYDILPPNMMDEAEQLNFSEEFPVTSKSNCDDIFSASLRSIELLQEAQSKRALQKDKNMIIEEYNEDECDTNKPGKSNTLQVNSARKTP